VAKRVRADAFRARQDEMHGLEHLVQRHAGILELSAGRLMDGIRAAGPGAARDPQ
jgi:hypothetical protein